MVLSMARWVGKVAVVTGASAGIGAAIAERLVKEGLKVAGLDINKDKLDALVSELAGKKGKLFPFKTDLTKEQDILDAFKRIKEDLGPVHILINNAGILNPGHVFDGDTEAWRNIFEVNVIGLSTATREAVRDMRVNNVDGHIIHINSLVGHQVVNFPLSVYPASKFAVTALAETLRLELNSLKLKIKITNLTPGPVMTAMVPAAFDAKKLREEEKIVEPEQIADAVVYALSTPPHVQIQQLTVRPIFDAV